MCGHATGRAAPTRRGRPYQDSGSTVGHRCRGAVSALGIYNSLQQCADTPLNAQSRRVVGIPTKMQPALPPS